MNNPNLPTMPLASRLDFIAAASIRCEYRPQPPTGSSAKTISRIAVKFSIRFTTSCANTLKATNVREKHNSRRAGHRGRAVVAPDSAASVHPTAGGVGASSETKPHVL
jgi:hypothetical protein